MLYLMNENSKKNLDHDLVVGKHQKHRNCVSQGHLQNQGLAWEKEQRTRPKRLRWAFESEESHIKAKTVSEALEATTRPPTQRVNPTP